MVISWAHGHLDNLGILFLKKKGRMNTGSASSTLDAYPVFIP